MEAMFLPKSPGFMCKKGSASGSAHISWNRTSMRRLDTLLVANTAHAAHVIATFEYACLVITTSSAAVSAKAQRALIQPPAVRADPSELRA